MIFEQLTKFTEIPILWYFQCYKRILELEPDNIQGLHNLCVVYVERGNLLRAETCLKQAHRLAPTEDYVLRHLKIVQSRVAKLRVDENSPTADSQVWDKVHQFFRSTWIQATRY